MLLCRAPVRGTDVTTLQNSCKHMRRDWKMSKLADVTTLQNSCKHMLQRLELFHLLDVTTLQNSCKHMRFLLFSCFNLAGCNPIHRETGEQSRQVRRRRFGIIHPYFVIN